MKILMVIETLTHTYQYEVIGNEFYLRIYSKVFREQIDYTNITHLPNFINDNNIDLVV